MHLCTYVIMHLCTYAPVQYAVIRLCSYGTTRHYDYVIMRQYDYTIIRLCDYTIMRLYDYMTIRLGDSATNRVCVCHCGLAYSVRAHPLKAVLPTPTTHYQPPPTNDHRTLLQHTSTRTYSPVPSHYTSVTRKRGLLLASINFTESISPGCCWVAALRIRRFPSCEERSAS
jgi:hypothetical protein